MENEDEIRTALAAKKAAEREVYYATKGRKSNMVQVERLVCHHCQGTAGHTLKVVGKDEHGNKKYAIVGGCPKKHLSIEDAKYATLVEGVNRNR